ncbi:MAG: hypothetical protein ACRDZR_16500 [Acidimicrobiales bacterium]
MKAEYLGEAGNSLALGIVNSLSGHAALEEEIAFPAISSQVGSPLVEALDREHGAIARTLHTLSGLSKVVRTWRSPSRSWPG